MNADDVRTLLKKQPFKPFNVHLSDQVSYHIPHSDWALVEGKGATMVVMEPVGGFAWLDIDHITRITQDEAITVS
jgi:hypothetical protein